MDVNIIGSDQDWGAGKCMFFSFNQEFQKVFPG